MDDHQASDSVAIIRRHIAARLAEAPLEKSPFPHLVVDGFFPAAVYRDVLRLNTFRPELRSLSAPFSRAFDTTAPVRTHFWEWPKLALA